MWRIGEIIDKRENIIFKISENLLLGFEANLFFLHGVIFPVLIVPIKHAGL